MVLTFEYVVELAFLKSSYVSSYPAATNTTVIKRSYANLLEQRHFFTLQKCQSPTDVYLYTNMAAVFIVLYTNMAAVTSGENDL